MSADTSDWAEPDEEVHACINDRERLPPTGPASGTMDSTGQEVAMRPKSWGVWCALVAGGVAMMALPDDDVRVFTISRTHGPAALDAVGIVLVLVAWVLLLAGVWTRRSRLPRQAGWWATIGASLVGGLGLVAWSVLADRGKWWLLGIALAGGAQVVVALAVSGRQARTREPFGARRG